jgi:integrase
MTTLNPTKITVRGITATLYTVPNSPHYRLYFRHPQTRERKRVSLGTSDTKMATAKAKMILGKVVDEGIKVIKDFARRDTAPSVGKVVDHYLQVSPCGTRKANANYLLQLYRVVYDLPTKESAREQSISKLNSKLVAEFLRKSTHLAAYSKRSYLAAARSVFSRVHDWHDLKLPDLSEFMKASSKTGVKAPSNSFRHISKDILKQMDLDSRKLEPAYRRAFIMCRFLGVTPKEVSFARRDWIEERGGKHVLCIRERSEENFTLKTGGLRERDIGLLPWMAEELRAADDYIIEAHTPYLRKKFMERQFNDWVRKYIPDRKGAAYELRKQAGSEWLEHYGKISLVSKLLGHSTPQTTAKWYATWEKQVDVPEIFVPATE